MSSPFAYWLIDLATPRGARTEVTAFARWLRAQAEQTREQMTTPRRFDVVVHAP
jgi:hypothetical protein